jgi:hypothetical protein
MVRQVLNDVKSEQVLRILSPLTLLEGEKQEIRMPITLLFGIGKQLFLIYN